ncbi:MAG: hypothetical protein ACF8XB_06885 [Planctomycetota bacterium JB042]
MNRRDAVGRIVWGGAGAALVACGAAPPAGDGAGIDRLRTGLEDGSIDAAAALVDPAHRTLRASPEFRALMREHLRDATLTIVSADEPGTPLEVSGRVVDTEGNPIRDARIHVYQTDDRGYYGVERSDDQRNPRLYGYLRTGADGRYALRTVRPGHYAHAPDGPQHIHFEFGADGHRRARGVGPPSLFFADDETLLDEYLEEIESDGAHVGTVARGEDGVERCTYDLVLRRE